LFAAIDEEIFLLSLNFMYLCLNYFSQFSHLSCLVALFIGVFVEFNVVSANFIRFLIQEIEKKYSLYHRPLLECKTINFHEHMAIYLKESSLIF
jgi:hypothetical protein